MNATIVPLLSGTVPTRLARWIMFDNPIYAFPIEKVLEELQVVKGRCAGMYYSPFREEKFPSFHVDFAKNLWYDHGIGTGGTNVQLVQLVRHCTQKEAEDFITALSTVEDAARSAARPQPSEGRTVEVVSIKELQMPFLVDYITGRGIPISIAARYCCEIMLVNHESGRHYFAVGFLNNAGGFAMKSPYGYKTTTKSGVTTSGVSGNRDPQASSGITYIFEGFFDFLSLLAIKGVDRPDADAVILNSVNNLPRALPYLRQHSRVDAFLDNDNAGRACLETLRGALPGVVVFDRSDMYKDCKDLNEYLIELKKKK